MVTRRKGRKGRTKPEPVEKSDESQEVGTLKEEKRAEHDEKQGNEHVQMHGDDRARDEGAGGRASGTVVGQEEPHTDAADDGEQEIEKEMTLEDMLGDKTSGNESKEVEQTDGVHFIFRNYKPRSPQLIQRATVRVQERNVVDEQVRKAVDGHVHRVLAGAKRSEAELAAGGDSLASLVPRAVDWDLKRDMASRLGQLQDQTRAALERLRGQAMGKVQQAAM